MTVVEAKEFLKSNGFEGFRPISYYSNNSDEIPEERGVYVIINPSEDLPEFLTVGTGGHFKEKNPNVDQTTLASAWITDLPIVYIGKAGTLSGKATLHSRLKQYLEFGRGKKVGHWGGRYIWQLKHASTLLICWKTIKNKEPRLVEHFLLLKIIEHYGKLPFANLKL